ncbi:MAG: sigma 54-interacting transcriptional regulator [Syntrophomonas sp.]
MPELRISDLQVGEAMTGEYGTVHQDTLISELIELMPGNHWEEVMVVDKEQQFVGMITREQIVRVISQGLPQDLPVKTQCSNRTVTTTPEEELVVARDIMRKRKIGRLPVLDKEGRVVGVLTARDVCNGFSSKLEMLGEHMYAVMENISEAIQVIDCNGVVNFWNRGAEELFGIKARDIMGRNLDEFMPDDLPLKVVSTMEPCHNLVSEIKEGFYIRRNAVPVVFSNGEIVGAVCTSMDVSQIMNLIKKLDKAKLRVRNLERLVGEQEDDDKLFYTVNTETLKIVQQARRVADTDATVLIMGESGTGKELLANVIYRESKRSNKPLIEINCGAIPEALFESEMFGYEAGSFTGALKSGKPGKFELARGGTLFLDEVGELPYEMQSKLLRVLQEKTFYRVGGTVPVKSNVRVIAASNQPLERLVEENRFRRDLYYRLSVVVLEIPPLRERSDDIPGLTRLFVKRLASEYGKEVEGIEPQVLDVLSAYSWPGNVRQLRNLLESVFILMDENAITMESLEEAGVLDMLLGGNRTSGKGNHAFTSPAAGHTGESLDEMLGTREKEAILEALKTARYNKAQAAQILGIPRSTLYYKMKALGIPVGEKMTLT